MEEWVPKVVGLDDLLGSGHTREVGTAIAYVEIIKDVFDFFMGEAMMEKGVDTLFVKNISNKKVMKALIENVLSIIVSEMWGEFLSVQVCTNVPIPCILHSDEEEMFIGEIVINLRFNIIDRKVDDELNEG